MNTEYQFWMVYDVTIETIRTNCQRYLNELNGDEK